MFNLCFPFIPSLFYIVLNDDYMLCKVTLGVLKGASKLNVLLLLLLLDRESAQIRRYHLVICLPRCHENTIATSHWLNL